VVGLGQAVLDAVLGAGEFEAVGAEDLAAVDGLADERCGRGLVAGRGELLRDSRLQGVEAVIERQQGMVAEGDDDRLLFS
jgi:hypothetical protein